MKVKKEIPNALFIASLAAGGLACRISQKIPVFGEVNINFGSNNTVRELSLDYESPRGQRLHESVTLTKNAGEIYLTRFGANDRESYGQEIGRNKKGVWVRGKYHDGAWEIGRFDLRDYNPFRRR